MRQIFVVSVFSLLLLKMSPAHAVPPCVVPEFLPPRMQAFVPCGVILSFREGTSEEERAAVLKETGADLKYNYRLVSAAAAVAPNFQALRRLWDHSDVVELIPDRMVKAIEVDGLSPTGSITVSSGSQVVPAGVQRIGATGLSVTGNGVGVAIGDTGIDLLHADLNVSSNCYTAFSGTCQDGHSHGTHVSGIVGAKNNGIDVVGVAPSVTLYAVKMLNDSGSGSDSTIIAGLDWIADNANLVDPPIRVVNMSLGRSGSLNDNPALRAAVQNLTDDPDHPITVVVAAGNSSNREVSQQVPATYPEVLAIASSTATDGTNRCRWLSGPIRADTASYFTTDGKYNATTGIGVTMSAPGNEKEAVSRSCLISSTGILSTRLGGGTTRMSGTSMASPHAAGVVALMEEANGGIDLDPETARCEIRLGAVRIGTAPLNSPSSSYSYDGEREGILSAPGALNASCP